MKDVGKFYVVSVEHLGAIAVYTVKADSLKEAKEKAKKQFMKEFWKKNKLRAYIEDSYLQY